MIHARPNFICIGSPKAGTTWFHQMMGLHPDVWMSLLKETHYFDGRFGTTVKVPRAAMKNRINTNAESAMKNHGAQSVQAQYWGALRNGIWTPTWYDRVFDHPNALGRLCGESTPAYAALPREAVQRIRDNLPDVRIIHFIRDPVRRSMSALRMIARMSGFDPSASLDTPWLLQRTKARGFIERGNYADQIPLWRDVFPDDRLLYVPFDDIRTDPIALLRRIEAFLGLPEAHYDLTTVSKTVHRGQHFEIDPQIEEHLAESLAHQRAFLQSTFGETFCART